MTSGADRRLARVPAWVKVALLTVVLRMVMMDKSLEDPEQPHDNIQTAPLESI